MTKHLSEKIKVLSFISILLVLYIHSGFHNNETLNQKYINTIQDLLSGKVARIAVPLFYIFSGYLFFLKAPDGLKSIFAKMQKRIRTLVLPYIFSASFFVILSVIICNLPSASKFMNSNIMLLFQDNWMGVLQQIYYGKNGGVPLAFQLWFLRDLILLVLFSPIWYYLIKFTGWYWLIVVFILCSVYAEQTIFTALFWFGTGACLTKYKFKYHPSLWGYFFMLIFLSLGVIELYYPNSILSRLNIPITFVGIVGLWLIYDHIIPFDMEIMKHQKLENIFSFTFFVYLYHEPTLNIIRKSITFMLGKESLGLICSYIFSPWIFIVIAVLIGMLMKKFIPKIYFTLVGGR